MLELGSLFDGIAGFPYSASKFGIKAVWASEIEPFPIKVSSHHFPNMKHLGDITKINGAEIEPVDIITFGSPCQDLSVAGKRAGLDGERSGLFLEAIRIIREMRDATNGKYPRFAVWENVPGAFSSNGGQDFRAVLEAFTDTPIPMPISGGWADAGVVRTDRIDIAWRVLDAQYWGVPQRRRRIFLVADFGGQSAAEILFKPESLRRNIAESGEARKKAAEAIGDGIETAAAEPGVHQQTYVIQNATRGESQNGLGVSTEDVSYTLDCLGNHAVATVDCRIGYRVRRLTPLECERLQGFPDYWTDIPGASDTARYKAIGNSVAIPCVDYVLGGIAEVLEREASA